MSACPVPSEKSHCSSIRAVCKTPLSYVMRILETCNYTEVKVFGLILDRSIGWSKPSAEIPDSDFDRVTQVTPEYWREALVNLVDNRKLVHMRRGEQRGRIHYSISQELVDETRAKKIHGKCEKCKQVGLFDTEFIPLPHTFFQNLPACVSHACYLVTAAICRYSLKWTAEHGLWSEQVELDKADIERLTEQDPRSITTGIAEAVRLGIIGRIQQVGRPAIYWAIPEQFGKLSRLGPRQVTPPVRASESATKSTKSESVKTAINPENTQAIKSAAQYFGICKSCGHFGAVEVMEPTEDRTGSSPPKKPPSRIQKMDEVLKKWFDAGLLPKVRTK